MCLGIPGQVVDIVDAEQSLAKVDVNGVRRNISVRLLTDDNLQVGDWVLVHVGFAMAKIDEREAAMTLDHVAGYNVNRPRVRRGSHPHSPILMPLYQSRSPA